MTLKQLAARMRKLADDMQEMFDGMTEAEQARADELSLATFQGGLYATAEEVEDALRFRQVLQA